MPDPIPRSQALNPSNMALSIASKHADNMGARIALAADIESALLEYAEFIAAPRWGKCSRCGISHDWPNREGGKSKRCVREGAKKPTPVPPEDD